MIQDDSYTPLQFMGGLIQILTDFMGMEGFGMVPLMYVAKSGPVSRLRTLVEHGASLSLRARGELPPTYHQLQGSNMCKGHTGVCFSHRTSSGQARDERNGRPQRMARRDDRVASN